MIRAVGQSVIVEGAQHNKKKGVLKYTYYFYKQLVYKQLGLEWKNYKQLQGSNMKT